MVIDDHFKKKKKINTDSNFLRNYSFILVNIEFNNKLTSLYNYNDNRSYQYLKKTTGLRLY